LVSPRDPISIDSVRHLSENELCQTSPQARLGPSPNFADRQMPSIVTYSPRSISVVIPAFNEQEAIREILSATSELLQKRGGDWEVIVVDNGSTDGTCDVVEGFRQDPRIRLLRNGANRGKGFSIRRGMLDARHELRLMCDADCTSSLSSLGRMEVALEHSDIVLGSRLAPGSEVAQQQPLRRRTVGLGFLVLTRLFMGRLARDVYCGFKLWTAEAAEGVFPMVTLDGWVFDAEALALARKLGFDTSEVGIAWSDRRNSRLSIRSVLISAVKELRVARQSVRRHELSEGLVNRSTR